MFVNPWNFHVQLYVCHVKLPIYLTFLGKREPPKPRSKLCEDCGKVFHSLSGIYHHIKTTHEAPGSFPCDKCDRIFDHKNALAGHKKNVHNKLPCTFCGKLFPGYRLKVHINAVHTEEHLKPFLCQVCQKGFATEGRLNDHMNIHTGNRPHVSILVGSRGKKFWLNLFHMIVLIIGL